MEYLGNETLVDLIRKSTRPEDQKQYLEELYQTNYLYIRKVCKKYSVYEDIDDLTQTAFFGLRLAVEKYDPEQNVPFMAYAVTWIESAVMRYIENCGCVVRLPVYLRNAINKYERVKKTFLQDHGREPTDEELCELLSLTPAQLQKVKDRSVFITTASIDTAISEDDDSLTVKDMIIDPEAEAHFDEIDNQMDDDIKKRDVRDAVNALDDRKAYIIKRRFKDGRSLTDIGTELNISNEAVRQQQNKALHLLSRSEKIRVYAAEYLSARAYSGTGLRAYLNTGTSSTERTAIDRIDNSIQAHIRENDRQIRRAEKSKSLMQFKQDVADKIRDAMKA